MARTKPFFLLLAIILFASCDYFDDAKKLHAEVQYYKDLYSKHQDKFKAAQALQEKYKGELDVAEKKVKQLSSDFTALKAKYAEDLKTAELKIQNLNIDLEKAKREIQRTQDLHKRMLE